MPPPIKYARSGDIRIAYEVVGDGRVDLLFNWTITRRRSPDRRYLTIHIKYS